MKTVLFLTLCVIGFATPAFAADPATSAQPITVYKTPSCGCCQAWVDYLGRNGFDVTAHNLDELTTVKQRLGFTNPALYSCHTAVVDGYVIEGHVPAADILRLLDERPPLLGLTAPDMPRYSPGMMSEQPRGYDVLGIGKDGAAAAGVFSRY